MLLSLSKLLIAPQHLHDERLLSLRQKANIEHVGRLGHGAFIQDSSVQLTF